MPNIGNYEAKIGPPVLLTLVLLSIIPSSPGYIDCRISCRRCHENTEHPAVLEVYCAMCEECKQRRRERIQGRTGKGNPASNPSAKPTLRPLTRSKQMVRMRDGVEANDNDETMIRPQENVQFRQAEADYPEQQQPVDLQQLLNPAQRAPAPGQLQRTFKRQKVLRGMTYPAGCPTPPLCSDTEDEVETLQVTNPHPNMTTAATTTTTTTTTTQQPCPPIVTCRKKKKPTPGSCTNPCMFPPFMCPCPMYPPTSKPYLPSVPPDHPVNPYLPHPGVQYPQPMQQPYPYPPPVYPPQILVPMHPQWQGWYPPPYPPSTDKPTDKPPQEEVKPQTNETTTNKSEDYFYLHVGLPVQTTTTI